MVGTAALQVWTLSANTGLKSRLGSCRGCALNHAEIYLTPQNNTVRQLLVFPRCRSSS